MVDLPLPDSPASSTSSDSPISQSKSRSTARSAFGYWNETDSKTISRSPLIELDRSCQRIAIAGSEQSEQIRSRADGLGDRPASASDTVRNESHRSHQTDRHHRQ